MYVMNKKWDSITNIAQCTSVYVSPEHEIKAVPTGDGASDVWLWQGAPCAAEERSHGRLSTVHWMG